MSQEGHQMKRKSKRVTSGKRQNLETHYLFNFLLDVLDNNDVRKKQEKSLSKHGDFIVNPKTLVAELK
jgi:hypothetical protein